MVSKGQLTRTFCQRIFCSSSYARTGVSKRPSGPVDSGIFLAVCGRLAAVEKTRRERRVYALCELTAGQRFFNGSYRCSLDVYADTDCKLLSVWVALSVSVLNLWDIFSSAMWLLFRRQTQRLLPSVWVEPYMQWLLLLYRGVSHMHHSDHIFYYFSVNFIARELQLFPLHLILFMLPLPSLSFFSIKFLYYWNCWPFLEI